MKSSRISVTLLAFTAMILAAGIPAMAGGGPAAAETTTVVGPAVGLTDDIGRSSLCVDFSTGSFTWSILSGPGAGGFFVGTGQVLYLNGPWSLIYSTPTLAVSAVYDGNNNRAAGGMRFSGGGGTKIGSGGYLTSTLYDSNTANDAAVGCGSPEFFKRQSQPKTPGEGDILAGTQAAPEVTIPAGPTVFMMDNLNRAEACVDFTSGFFEWEILTGPYAGNFFTGQGQVLYLNGPWGLVYSTPDLAVSVYFNGTFWTGTGGLRSNSGGGGGGTKGSLNPPMILSTIYSPSVEARQQACGD